METNNQLTLFGGIVSEEISKVFSGKKVFNAKQAEVGLTVGLRKRKEIAATLNLTHKNQKDDLDGAILAQRDAMWLQLKAKIASLGPDWTFAKMTERKLGNGTEQISFVTQRIPRAKAGPTDEQIAALLGLSLDEVQELRRIETEKQKATEVTSTVAEQSAEPVSA